MNKPSGQRPRGAAVRSVSSVTETPRCSLRFRLFPPYNTPYPGPRPGRKLRRQIRSWHRLCRLLMLDLPKRAPLQRAASATCFYSAHPGAAQFACSKYSSLLHSCSRVFEKRWPPLAFSGPTGPSQNAPGGEPTIRENAIMDNGELPIHHALSIKDGGLPWPPLAFHWNGTEKRLGESARIMET